MQTLFLYRILNLTVTFRLEVASKPYLPKQL